MAVLEQIPASAIVDALLSTVEACREPKSRTMLEFAEQKVIIPEGDYAGEPYRCYRQPYAKLWFDAVDSGNWVTFVATGPSQSGKTLSCYIIPMLYHLFELNENVVCGIPDMKMAGDKWRVDILPIIMMTEFAELLPTKGPGSRGGKVHDVIRFKNGAELKFMSGGGGDKHRAGYSSRVLVITEVDALCNSSESSEEADKIEQMLARLRSHGTLSRRVYLECTVTTRFGYTWAKYEEGTHSKIIMPCQHCGGMVTLEREHLLGWQDCENQIEVLENTYWCCSACGAKWSERDRLESINHCELLHKGQEVDAKGKITGDLPQTLALGFRWSAVNNKFLNAGDIGCDLWDAQRKEDVENAEKKLCQFVFAEPYESPDLDEIPLRAADIQNRTQLSKGVIPKNTVYLTMGIDVHKKSDFWVLIAWMDDLKSHIVDYGIFDNPHDRMEENAAIYDGLDTFKEQVINVGWHQAGRDEPRIPDAIWVDSGYKPEAIYPFVCMDMGRYKATKGFSSVKRYQTKKYISPTKKTKDIRQIGLHYHFKRIKESGRKIMEIDADFWKGRVHKALKLSSDIKGSTTLFAADSHAHITFAHHMVSEMLKKVTIEGQGEVLKWKVISKNKTHYLDATALAFAAAHYCGFRLIEGLGDANTGKGVIKSYFANQKRR
jgi:phage terminase large subunit GpA-like protein